MARSRLGVALLLPTALRAEIELMRRALGDDQFERIPTHLTLVPPVNVRELDVAVEIVRTAAARSAPVHTTLGPPMTFLPNAPVLWLAVSGDLAKLQALRDQIFVPPLARTLSWPYVPHVTLVDDGEPRRIEAAVTALAGFELAVTFSSVSLLEERDRSWTPIAEFALAAPAVIGRGVLELEITASEQLEPEARAFAVRSWADYDAAQFGPGTRWDRHPCALTARREGSIVGVATGWMSLGVGYLSELVVAEHARAQGVGSRLLAAFEDLAVRRNCHRMALRTDAGSDAQRFYAARGWEVEATFTRWLGGRDFVQMRRDRGAAQD